MFLGEKMIVLLSGGTGTPKLLQGLLRILPAEDICVIVNTAEDSWLPHGYFSPDVDTVLYTFAGIIDDEVWHGIKDDSFYTHKSLLELGYDEILKIGDRDRATHIYRGILMRQGHSLSRAIEELRLALGVKGRVYPMSDDPVKTVISTPEKDMDLHEFWVENKGSPEITGIKIEGALKARPCLKALEAIESADGIIIGPSNPVSSILPIISIPGIKRALRSRNNRIAVSPIIGNKPVSGPADKFMRALGVEPTPRGVAELYEGLIDYIVIDSDDEKFEIDGVKILKTDILMNSSRRKKALAEFVLRALNISPGGI